MGVKLLLSLFLVAFFVFASDIHAKSSLVIINEIQTSGLTANDEFIELHNNSSGPIDISKWSIQYRGGSGASYYKKNFVNGNIVPANGYFLVAHGGAENYAGFVIFDMSWSQSLSSSGGTIFLVLNQTILSSDNSDAIVDKVGYGMSASFEFLQALAPGEGKSIERKNFQDTDNNKNDFELNLAPSPKNSGCLEEQEKCEIKKEENESIPVIPRVYSDKIQITELFPNPFQAQYEEYVELYNGSAEDVDLLGWTLHDASKTGKYTFTQSVILKTQKLLAVFKKDFKFALNNSGDESVTLFDPSGKEVAKASYDGSKKNVSYNFDGSRWRWSKFLTPGAENILNNEPYGTLKIDKNIFKNAYANFSVSTGDVDGDKVKITWDFGDGHKSYLSKTRHKYEETGTFNGSVKLSDGSEDVVKTFVIKVKKYPHPKVRIIGVNANPVGSDTLGESLTIENKSKEKINLEGWSIATGSKTLANHPIIEKFILKKKEIKEITREISKFTLNNKKGKIELRYPDGEVADKIKYEKKEGIEEGEIYKKIDGGWEWVGGEKSESHQSSVTSNQEDNAESLVISNQSASSADGSSDVNVNSTAEVAGVETVKKEYSFVMLENNVEIGKMEFQNSDSRVLGTEIVREADGQYFLTPIAKEKQHYALTFFNDVFLVINSKLNTLLNYFRT